MLNEKEHKKARNNAVLELKISCGKCGSVMRNLGEWPIQTDEIPDQTIQTARWACNNCKYPVTTENSGIYQCVHTIYIPLE